MLGETTNRTTGVRVTPTELIEMAQGLVEDQESDIDEFLASSVKGWLRQKLPIDGERRIFLTDHDVKNFITGFISCFWLAPGAICEIRNNLDDWLQQNRSDPDETVI